MDVFRGKKLLKCGKRKVQGSMGFLSREKGG